MADTRARQITQLAGVMVMVAGRGWAAGVFSVGNPWWTSLVLSVPVVIPVVLALMYFQTGDVPTGDVPTGGTSRHWAAIGMHVYAGLSLLLAAFSIGVGVTGASVPDIGARTLTEVIPTVTIGIGALLWLAALIGPTRGTHRVEYMAKAHATRG